MSWVGDSRRVSVSPPWMAATSGSTAALILASRSPAAAVTFAWKSASATLARACSHALTLVQPYLAMRIARMRLAPAVPLRLSFSLHWD